MALVAIENKRNAARSSCEPRRGPFGAQSPPFHAMWVHIRVPGPGGAWEGASYEVDKTLPVIGFKALVADCHAAVSNMDDLRLLFKGRALGDGGSLEEAGVEDGATLHCTLASRPGGAAALPAAAQTLGPPPPSAESALLNNPLVSSMLESPEALQMLQGQMMNNPQMRSMLEANPEMAHVLNDPATLRQSLQTARNPQLMREQMRSTDRALSNLEAHPDGFNALRRMYSTVQQPLYESMAGGGAEGDEGSGGGSSSSSSGGAPGAINTTPLPNPWAPRPQAANPLMGFGGWGGAAVESCDVVTSSARC